MAYFYKTTRPFGFWGPLRRQLPQERQKALSREHRIEGASAVIALVWQVSLFLLPMQLLTHNFSGLFVTGPIFLMASFGLYFVWWRNLPPADEVVADYASRPPLSHAPLTMEAAKSEITTG